MRYSTGEQTAANVVSDGSGDVAWTASGGSLASDLAASDDVRAVASGLTLGKKTDVLVATGFGSTIPARASICGVRVRIERSSDTSLAVTDSLVALRMADGSDSAENKASSGSWPTSDASAFYGGANDQWGETLTPAELNSDDSGVAVRAEGLIFSAADARIDYLTREVWYELGQDVRAEIERAGPYTRARLWIRADGDGNVSYRLTGRDSLPLPAVLDHVLVLADPDSAPASGWNLYVCEPAGADLLTGPDGTSLCTGLASDVAAAYWPYASTGAYSRHGDVVLREVVELKADGMDADGAALIVLYLRAA